VLAYKHYDARADICSLGLTMYCLLNGGKPPFFGEGDDYNAISRRVNGEKIPPIRGMSAGLNAIILKACAFEPDSRYKTAREMRGALENNDQFLGYDWAEIICKRFGTG
jgi:serine/threonine protein kinase